MSGDVMAKKLPTKSKTIDLYDNLTTATIERLAKKPPAEIRTIKEQTSPGLELRHYPSGKLIWTHYYRFGPRNYRHSLGTFPAINLRTARSMLADNKSKIQHGINPSAAAKAALRQEERSAANTVAAAWARYIAEELPDYRDSVQRVRRSNIERYLIPLLGRRSLAEIKRGEMRDWIRDIAGMKSNRGGKLSSNTVAAIRSDVTSFFSWCETVELIDMSPMIRLRLARSEQQLVKKTPDLSYFSDAELKAIWHAAEEYTRRLGNPHVEPIVKFTLLTGIRASNVTGLRRAARIELDGVICLEFTEADMKMGRRWRVPLSQIALNVLDEVTSTGPLYFPGKTSKPFDFGTTTRRKIRELSGVENFTLKRLRTTITTRLAEIRDENGDLIDRLSIEEALARETRRGAEANYQASDFLEQKRRAMDAWGKHIAGLVGWTSAAENVVEMRRERLF